MKHHNIVVTNNISLKICDFGVSKQYGIDQTPVEKVCVGTIAFHSPEVYKNDSYDPRKCDIWAVGLIFYHMIFGKYPLTVKKVETFLSNLRSL